MQRSRQQIRFLPRSATGLRRLSWASSVAFHCAAIGWTWYYFDQLAEISFQVERGRSTIQLVAQFATAQQETPMEVMIEEQVETPTTSAPVVEVSAEETKLERSLPIDLVAERRQLPNPESDNARSTSIDAKRREPITTTLPQTTPKKPAIPRPQALAEVRVETTVPMTSIQSTGSLWDTPPTSTPTNRAPAYPAASLAARQQGTVLLLVRIGADGAVEKVSVATSSGFRELDVAATEAVKQWRFNAARRGTRSVAAEVQVPIVFQLR